MFKKIAAAALILGLTATSALSYNVFEYSVGYWNINGYSDDYGNKSCVVSTNFTNGAVININVFPKGSDQYTTMTVYNPSWSATPRVLNESFTESLIFRGKNTGTVKITDRFQIYGPRKVILRGLSGDFSYLFIKAREMVVFPGTRDQFTVSLTGTQAVTDALDECIDSVSELGD